MKSGRIQNNREKYFLIGASKDHVLTGVKHGFAQAGHGRKDFVSKLSKGDWIVYYSAKEKFKDGEAYQRFTAIGQVKDNEPYQPNVQSDLKPFRRDIKYKKSKEAKISPLIESLSFIKNKRRWGFYFISGFREIPKEDFEVIKYAMK